MVATNFTTSTELSNIQEKRIELKYSYIYCAIGVSAVLSNGLLCTIFGRRRKMLQQAYNIIIFTLAIIDTLTGISLIAVTAFQLHLFPQTNGKQDGHEPIKALLLQGMLEFYFGIISALLVVFLAIERWCAVKRPIQYRCYFHRNRVYVYIVSVVVFTTLHHILIVIVSIINNRTGMKGFLIASLILTLLIPLLVTWITFIQLWLHSRSYPHQKTYNSKAKQKLVNMCAITALFFTLCWLPSQVQFFIDKMEFISDDFVISKKPFDFLAMSNSIVNPWIYYFSNLHYRKEFNALLKGVFAPVYYLLDCLRKESYEVGESVKYNGK